MSNNNTAADTAYEWDATIENDSEGFILLPEGDYDFEVVSYERARHPGSDKLPPCNKAVVHIKVTGVEGSTTIKHNLFLHTKTEGMLCAFFTAIGQRRQGEKYSMNWNAVTGSRGRCKVGIRKFTGENGNEQTYNEIKRFYEPGETKAAAGFEPGKF